MIFKNLGPQDVLITPFKTYKDFTFTNVDSGSGVYSIQGLSGSKHNFDKHQAESHSFGAFNEASKSLGKDPYSLGTFYKIPTYWSIRHLYYRDGNKPYHSFGNSDTNKTFRNLHNKVNVISVPQKLYGEQIKPGSVKLTDDSTSQTFTLYDDSRGNLYDNTYSASFAAFVSSSFDDSKLTANGSGSAVGNVFYEQGLICITDTGSYGQTGRGEGTDGWELDYKATHTIYEHEIYCNIGKSEFNRTMNISATSGRSGSISVAAGSPEVHRVFAPGDNPQGGSGSLQSSYEATEFGINHTTHSDFAPYITTVGLYNDNCELLAISKLGRPIKRDKGEGFTVVVRFDV